MYYGEGGIPTSLFPMAICSSKTRQTITCIHLLILSKKLSRRLGFYSDSVQLAIWLVRSRETHMRGIAMHK